MTECELLNKCQFFNDQIEDIPTKADICKIQYCKGDSSKCARYIVSRAIGIENIPPDLLPNHGDPLVTFCKDTGRVRFIFDRRSGINRRSGNDTDFLLGGRTDRRSGIERRKSSEQRKDWKRVTQWSSVYIGNDSRGLTGLNKKGMEDPPHLLTYPGKGRDRRYGDVQNL